GGDARDLRHRQVDDAPFVRVERAELLLEPGLPRLLRQKSSHLAQLDVFALAVLERIDEQTLLIRQRSAEGHVDDVLERLERLAAVPDQQLGVLALEVDARPVRRLLDREGRLDAERLGELLQKRDNPLRRILRHTAFLPPPTRFTRRSAAGRTVRTFAGPIR